MTGTTKKAGKKSKQKSSSSAPPSQSSSTGPDEPASPSRAPVSDPSAQDQAEGRRPLPERTTSLPVPDSAFEVLELRKELRLKTEQLEKALAAHRQLERQVESQEEQQLAELEAQRVASGKEMARLQAELQKKSTLLERQQVVLRELRSELTQEHATLVDELLEMWESEEHAGGGAHSLAPADAKNGFSAAALEAAEKENGLYREELQRLREEIDAVRQESLEAKEEAGMLRSELQGVRNPQGLGRRELANGHGNEELVHVVALLEKQLQEAREDKETTVTELLSQVMALNAKLTSAKKEREAAVHAAERKVEVMKRELAAVVERNEKNEAEVEKARTSIVKAEEYLKALDVARVEIKRLRLERDLMIDKLRSAEEELRKRGGMSSSEIASWLMPNCLLKHSQGGAKPDSPSA